ncbi:hypothetical protein UA08_08858 [Talaromyces atroroseus]|uniref:Transcription factor domain-containing protein n=1 Tax=Talaromyces atroroseus TaxID=1441469 RepID=A0A225AD08_TALAT|nr:hypothetical protein UA08_08858 [Talaromyces atroroseus]OKL55794.1 hypothetical protein UA08_08858 [Talaromyces atroroseus]
MSTSTGNTRSRKRPFPETNLANDRDVQAYYKSFHDGHPVMLPFSLIGGPLAGHFPEQVINIMRYIGKHYQKQPLPENFITQALSSLDSSSVSKPSGFHVQGLTLLAICAHAHGQHDQALSIVQKAVQLALTLDMHTEAFVSSNTHGSQHMEEMWRRLTFHNLHARWPKTLNFDDGLPSFGYRILAVHMLGRVLAHGPYSCPTGKGQNTIDEIDRALSELRKQDVVQTSLRYAKNVTHFEEMIFQGKMIANSASIYLYRPRSALITVHFDDPAFMSFFPRGFIQFAQLPSPKVHSDLLKDAAQQPLLDAAKSIARMLTSAVDSNRHSPFLVNGTILSIAVLTAARYHLKPKDPNRELYKNQIMAALGVLKKVENTWPWTKGVRSNLGKVYKGLFP